MTALTYQPTDLAKVSYSKKKLDATNLDKYCRAIPQVSDGTSLWTLTHAEDFAQGVESRLVHVASELFPVVAPDWFWSGEVLGDIGHTGVFDTSKSGGSYPGSRRG